MYSDKIQQFSSRKRKDVVFFFLRRIVQKQKQNVKGARFYRSFVYLVFMI